MKNPEFEAKRKRDKDGRFDTMPNSQQAEAARAHDVDLTATTPTRSSGDSDGARRLTDHRLVAMAMSEVSGGGALSRQLQAESPGGLAHSALTALRQGKQPSPQAAESLSKTLKWRDAWEQWHKATGDTMSRVAEAQADSRTVREIAARKRNVEQVLDGMGGPLPTAAGSEKEALERLRGTGWSAWGLDPHGGHGDEIAEIRLKRVRWNSDLDRALGALSPSEELSKVEQAMIATAVQDRHPGLVSQTRRYLGMVQSRLSGTLDTASEKAARSEQEGPGLDSVDAVAETHSGTPEARAMVNSAIGAASAGVRIADHQMAAVNALRIKEMPESFITSEPGAEVVYEIGLGDEHPDLEAGDRLHKDGKIWRIDAMNTASGLPGIWRLVSVDTD